MGTLGSSERCGCLEQVVDIKNCLHRLSSNIRSRLIRLYLTTKKARGWWNRCSLRNHSPAPSPTGSSRSSPSPALLLCCCRRSSAPAEARPWPIRYPQHTPSAMEICSSLPRGGWSRPGTALAAPTRRSGAQRQARRTCAAGVRAVRHRRLRAATPRGSAQEVNHGHRPRGDPRARAVRAR